MKEHLKECLRNFFIIVTCINVAMFVLGSILAPDQRFGYEAFVYPIFYAALASIPTFFVSAKRVLSVKQLLFREVLGMIIVMALLFVVMFGGRPITHEIIIIAVSVAVSVVVIVAAVNAITWILDSKTAQDMTADLKALQENAGVEE